MAFEEHRTRLFSLAYRMLGSAADAEDVVQATWERFAAVDDVRDEAALLTTIATRLCLDELRSARRRREAYVGPWLPEPVSSAELGPLETATQRESVALGALLLLERLSPAERAVCVLRDAFDYDYAGIASVLERTEAGCRQLHRRARQRLATGQARFDVAAGDHLALTERLFVAATLGDLAGLEELLAADVELISDGGGQVSAARRPVLGARKVAAFLVGVSRKLEPGFEVLAAELNGVPSLLLLRDGAVTSVVQVVPAGGRVQQLLIVQAPAKLARLSRPGVLSRQEG